MPTFTGYIYSAQLACFNYELIIFLCNRNTAVKINIPKLKIRHQDKPALPSHGVTDTLKLAFNNTRNQSCHEKTKDAMN